MTERELDQLLDAALPGYVAEPADGLAGRVVERARRRRVWPWAAGLAAAAGLAVAMLVGQGGGVQVEAPPLVTRAPRAPEVKPAARVVEMVKRVPVRRAAGRGLTPREARLLRFVQANPEVARQAFVEAPLRMAEPVSVAPLEVAPILIEPLAASGGEENLSDEMHDGRARGVSGGSGVGAGPAQRAGDEVLQARFRGEGAG